MSLTCHNAILDALAKAGHWQEAHHWLDRIRQAAFEPDAFSFGSLIHADAKASRASSALGTLRQMEKEESKSKPNAVCYNSALHACARSLWADEAVKLLGRMDLMRAPPNAVSYTTAIDTCRRVQPPRQQLALELFLQMVSEGVQPDEMLAEVMIQIVGQDEFDQMQTEQGFSIAKAKRRNR